MYTKSFEIRWSDVDANRHLANSAYINFMSHTRMGFLMENGFDQKALAAHNIGPVVFHEQIFYFKEVFPGKPIRVSLELKGLSPDGKYFGFLHNFYDHQGRNFARGEMMGAWIDLQTRKLTHLPDALLQNLHKMTKTEDFREITSADTRAHGQYPSDLKN